MPRHGSRRRAMVLAAGLAGWLVVVAARPALALAPDQAGAPPTPPGGWGPPCAGGPGGLIGCVPSPGEVLKGAARAAGDTAMGAFTAFFTDGAGWLVEKLKEFLVGADRPDLSVDWWVQRYQLMLALAMVVAGATLLLALLDAAAKASLEGLARAVFADVPVAAIVAAAGPLLIQYLVDLADWLSGRLLRDFGVDVAKTLGSSAEWFATFGTAATGGPTVPIVLGFVAALLTILAALIVFLELLLRANAIYLLAALIPVLYAVRIWPAAKAVARHTTEVLLAVIFAQPVVALAISMGAAAGGALEGIGDAAVKDFGQALAGAVFLLLGAMCPWGMLALVPGVERAVAAHRQRAAVTGGARSAIQVAYTGTYLGRLAAAGRSRSSSSGGGEDAAAAAATAAGPRVRLSLRASRPRAGRGGPLASARHSWARRSPAPPLVGRHRPGRPVGRRSRVARDSLGPRGRLASRASPVSGASPAGGAGPGPRGRRAQADDPGRDRVKGGGREGGAALPVPAT